MTYNVSRGLVVVYTDLVSLLVVNFFAALGCCHYTSTDHCASARAASLAPPPALLCTGDRCFYRASAYRCNFPCYYLSCCPLSVQPSGFHPTIKLSYFSSRGRSLAQTCRALRQLDISNFAN